MNVNLIPNHEFEVILYSILYSVLLILQIFRIFLGYLQNQPDRVVSISSSHKIISSTKPSQHRNTMRFLLCSPKSVSTQQVVSNVPIANTQRTPCLFVNHGGGTGHLYGNDKDPIKKHLLDVKSRFSKESIKPKSIIIISAHHEASPYLKISTPSASQKFHEYHAPGNPELAQRMKELLKSKEISSEVDNKRSLDHGALTPLLIAFPKADIPVVNLSLHASLNPEIHLEIGEALRPLRDEGVLIMASGMSYHNLRSMFRSSSGQLQGYDFDKALVQAVSHPDPKQRNELLTNWESFPGARHAHPREEHLMPLFICAGAAGSDIGKQFTKFNFMGSRVSGFSFEE